MNGGNNVEEECDSLGAATIFEYTHPVTADYETPDQTYYDNEYEARSTRIGSTLAATLYESTCLESLNGTATINDAAYGPFQYDTELLYDIEEDKVEACAVNNATKKQELLNILTSRASEYTPQIAEVMGSKGSFREQMASYDCITTYTAPWESNNNGNVDNIWMRFIEKQMECDGVTFPPTKSPTKSPITRRRMISDDLQFENYATMSSIKMLIIMLLALIVCTI